MGTTWGSRFKLLGGLKEELCFYKNAVGKQGFTEDLKSLLSEFMQYGITPDNLTEIKEKASSPVLAAKLQDAALVYRAFNNYKKEKYISAEQILEVLANEISRSKLLENSVICFDGYTGFTPVQLKVIDLLLTKAEHLLFTLTVSEKDYYSEEDEKFRFFHLSKDTINKINKLAGERGVEVARPVTAEFCGKVKALSLLERQIFRYPVKKTDSENAVRISVCKNPREEVERLIPDILSLVRDEGLRYRDIAVVLGDMEEYGEMVVDTLSSKGVPCFLDSKKTIADNPFVEYIKASLLVVEENFSYDAVMRYLRSGFAGVDADKVDIFENYILRRGIKGFRRYKTSFVKDEASEEESMSEGLRALVWFGGRVRLVLLPVVVKGCRLCFSPGWGVGVGFFLLWWGFWVFCFPPGILLFLRFWFGPCGLVGVGGFGGVGLGWGLFSPAVILRDRKSVV